MAASIYLKPGEWCFCESPALIETVLGSCVAVVLREPGGGTCVAHCILPRWDGSTAPEGTGRFVDRAIDEMLRLFARRGVAPGNLEAKLFGGARILAGRGGVGQGNVDAAVDALRRAGVPLAASNVGGLRGRKIAVDSATGEVLLRSLAPPRTEQLPPEFAA